jgi:hypothetical protein
MDKAIKLFLYLVIPTFAAGVFNVVGDLMKHGAAAQIELNDYDVSFGCVFSIVGVAAAQSDPANSRIAYAIFFTAFILTTVFDIVLRYHIPGTEIMMVGVSNAVSFFLAGLAIWVYGG